MGCDGFRLGSAMFCMHNTANALQWLGYFSIGVWVHGHLRQASRNDPLDSSLLANEYFLNSIEEDLCHQVIEMTKVEGLKCGALDPRTRGGDRCSDYRQPFAQSPS